MSEQWMGRDVVLTEYDIATGEELMELAKVANSEAEKRDLLYFQLVHSARYADDGSPVFASVADVRAQPFKLYARVQAMGLRAATLNQMEAADDGSGTFPEPAADAAASPRLSNGEAHQ